MVLDVDGTLLRTDLLFETFWAALSRRFVATLGATVKNWTKPARLKRELLEIAAPDIAPLPVHEDVLGLANAAQRDGRAVCLVSGSDINLVDQVATRFGLDGPNFGSDGDNNLTGAAKARLLQARFGTGGYDYAGNSGADLHAWAGARRIVAVAPDRALNQRLRKLGKPAEIIGQRWGLKSLIRELRPHQWIKNLILFVPMLATHDFSWSSFGAVSLAAVAFSLAASSIYILNDLLDLASDRRHPEKRNRPIAAGALPIQAAMWASPTLSLLALGLALVVGPVVAGLTLVYMLGSLTYSLWLKKWRWVDVLVLASLFLLRLVTGMAAAMAALPATLLAFGFVVFFVLACVKRLTALSRMPKPGHLPGRGYSRSDLGSLQRAAYAGIPGAALLFLAYAHGPYAALLYGAPTVVALAVLPIVAWLFRVVRLSSLGKEDYDPVRFVLHDKTGFAIALSALALIVLAV